MLSVSACPCGRITAIATRTARIAAVTAGFETLERFLICSSSDSVYFQANTAVKYRTAALSLVPRLRNS